MQILCYISAVLLIFAAAFLMWFFIFGRRAGLREGNAAALSRSDHIIPAILCVLICLIIAFDINQSLQVLEKYGDREIMHLLFFPVGALAVLFLMIPASMACSKRETLIPGTQAILMAFLFILILNLLCLCVIHDHETLSASLCHLVTGLLCSLVVYNTPRLSRDRYKAELLKIDSMVSEARNAHYEAVKKSSVETRRLRHDMKNHLIALKELAAQSRTEELLAYIDSITEQIEAAALPYRSGNDIADVIIADKYAKAEKRGLKLAISGDLAGVEIESADLVTILSNLLDNAIEAVSRLYGRDLPDEDKLISLELKKNANFMLITEKNKSMTRLEPGRIVSVKNSPDHGFGIMNIRRTVKKYGGEFNISCSEASDRPHSGGSNDLYLVEMEIMLPLKE